MGLPPCAFFLPFDLLWFKKVATQLAKPQRRPCGHDFHVTTASMGGSAWCSHHFTDAAFLPLWTDGVKNKQSNFAEISSVAPSQKVPAAAAGAFTDCHPTLIPHVAAPPVEDCVTRSREEAAQPLLDVHRQLDVVRAHKKVCERPNQQRRVPAHVGSGTQRTI